MTVQKVSLMDFTWHVRLQPARILLFADACLTASIASAADRPANSEAVIRHRHERAICVNDQSTRIEPHVWLAPTRRLQRARRGRLINVSPWQYRRNELARCAPCWWYRPSSSQQRIGNDFRANEFALFQFETTTRRRVQYTSVASRPN